MIDNFSIGVTHGLMMIAAIMLLFRRDLDHEKPPISDVEPDGWDKNKDQSRRLSKDTLSKDTLGKDQDSPRRA